MGDSTQSFRTVVLRYLDETYIADPQRIAIRFHFNYQASSSMTIHRLFSYMLKQLVLHRALASTTERLGLYRRKHPARPSEADILALLSAEIQTYDRVYIVLDALDESPGTMSLNLRQSLIQYLPDSASLLCTSRRMPDIMATFATDRLFDITAHNEDLMKFIGSVFDESSRLRAVIQRSEGLDEEKLASIVLEKAKGM